MMLMIGCASSYNSVEPSNIDETLPRISELRALSDINEVGLEWSPIHEENILGYYIYRLISNETSMKRIATIDDRYTSHFVDTSVKPQTSYTYFISSYAKSGYESVKSKAVSISTKQRLDAVGFVQAITNLPKRVKIIWRPHPFNSVNSYLIQKREIGKSKWKDEAEVKGRLSAEYIDVGLDNNEAFEYRVLAKTNQGLFSKPSPIVSAKTKSLPLLVENLKASNDIPKKIVLSWDKVANVDVVYYKVYSSPTSMLLYTYLAKTKQNSFEDLLNSNDTTRYYKVTAVDKDGLESEKQNNGIQGKTLSAPLSPNIIRFDKQANAIALSWTQADKRAVSYIVIKEYEGQKQLITGLKNESFSDSNLAFGVTYTYSVIAVDQYGLQSEPSTSYEVNFKNEDASQQNLQNQYEQDIIQKNIEQLKQSTPQNPPQINMPNTTNTPQRGEDLPVEIY